MVEAPKDTDVANDLIAALDAFEGRARGVDGARAMLALCRRLALIVAERAVHAATFARSSRMLIQWTMVRRRADDLASCEACGGTGEIAAAVPCPACGGGA